MSSRWFLPFTRFAFIIAVVMAASCPIYADTTDVTLKETAACTALENSGAQTCNVLFTNFRSSAVTLSYIDLTPKNSDPDDVGKLNSMTFPATIAAMASAKGSFSWDPIDSSGINDKDLGTTTFDWLTTSKPAMGSSSTFDLFARVNILDPGVPPPVPEPSYFALIALTFFVGIFVLLRKAKQCR